MLHCPLTHLSTPHSSHPLPEAYFRLDELLDSEEGKAELARLVAEAKPGGGKEPAGLFADVESKLAGAGGWRVQSESGRGCGWGLRLRPAA